MGDQANILVVDDTPENLHLLSQMLETQGYKVRAVLNGARALAAVRSTIPDLILLDIMMPDMDGYQVCQLLKADEQTRHIPIIFISALDAVQDKVRAFTEGGADYISKPFQIKEVLARVRTHLALQLLQKELQTANQELARQVDELRARNEELDTFARAVAYDLKTPLTSIIGFAEMLEKIYTTLPVDDVEQSLHTIAAKAREVNTIVDRLLFLSGVRQTQQVTLVTLDMGEIVQAALRHLEETVQQTGAEINLPPSWPKAQGYAPWVEEIWTNYICTALSWGGNPPRLELGSTLQPDNKVSFWVQNLAASATPEAHSKGSGLGLFVVRRVLEKLGLQSGTEGQSAAGQGNTLTFTLSG